MSIQRVLALVVALCLGLGFVVQGALPARACSCMAPDPYGGLAQADGAFVGTLVEREDRVGPVFDRGALIDFDFEVEAVVKGDIGETITVKSAADGAACGFEIPIGGRAGLLLDRVGGHWEGSLCWTLEGDVLLAAADGPPPPVSGSPPHVIASAYLGEAGLVALDVEGRIVGYGDGRPAWLMDACPDHATFIGIGDGSVVRTWSFEDLSQVDEVDLGAAAQGGFYNLACAGTGDFYALSVAGWEGDLPDLVLNHVIGDDVAVVSREAEALVETDDGILVIGQDGAVSRVETGSDELVPITEPIGDLHGKLATSNPSPGGRHLALSIVEWTASPLEAAIVVVDLETGQHVEMPTDCDSYPAWLDDSRLTFSDCTDGGFEVYSSGLESIGPGQDPWPRGFAGTAVDETGAVYVPVDYGVARIAPGSAVEQAWARLATLPNQVMVVPPEARGLWAGSDFVPPPPSEMVPTDGTDWPIFPVAPNRAAGASLWLVGTALAAVVAVLWLLMRDPAGKVGEEGLEPPTSSL